MFIETVFFVVKNLSRINGKTPVKNILTILMINIRFGQFRVRVLYADHRNDDRR